MFDHVLRELYPPAPPPRAATVRLTVALYFALALDVICRLGGGLCLMYLTEPLAPWSPA